MDISFDWRGLIIWIIDIGSSAIVFSLVYYFIFYKKIKKQFKEVVELLKDNRKENVIE
jgi:hypothetical protein